MVSDFCRGRTKAVVTAEIYKDIRKLRLEGVSLRQIAAQLYISRNTVKKYLDGDTAPREREEYGQMASVLTPEYRLHSQLSGGRQRQQI